MRNIRTPYCGRPVRSTTPPSGFAKTGEEIALLAEAVKSAQRSLDIATLQYREGLADFQRVLDSQRALFSQQELLVIGRGNLAQSLVALYKAMGGGWEQGRSRPVLDDVTRETMGQRSDWKTCGGPAAAAWGGLLHQSFRNGNHDDRKIHKAGRDPGSG